MPLFNVQLGSVDPLDVIEAESPEEAKQLYMDQFGILGTKNQFLHCEEDDPDEEPESNESSDEEDGKDKPEDDSEDARED